MSLGVVGKFKLALFVVVMIGVAYGLYALGVYSANDLAGIWSAQGQMVLAIAEVVLFGYMCASFNTKGIIIVGIALISSILFWGF